MLKHSRGYKLRPFFAAPTSAICGGGRLRAQRARLPCKMLKGGWLPTVFCHRAALAPCLLIAHQLTLQPGDIKVVFLSGAHHASLFTSPDTSAPGQPLAGLSHPTQAWQKWAAGQPRRNR